MSCLCHDQALFCTCCCSKINPELMVVKLSNKLDKLKSKKLMPIDLLTYMTTHLFCYSILKKTIFFKWFYSGFMSWFQIKTFPRLLKLLFHIIIVVMNPIDFKQYVIEQQCYKHREINLKKKKKTHQLWQKSRKQKTSMNGEKLLKKCGKTKLNWINVEISISINRSIIWV